MSTLGSRQDNEQATFALDSNLDVARRVLHSDPINIFVNFGSSSNIPAALNSTLEFDNSKGYSTIGFRIVPPTGGTVVFEGTFDDINWEAITFRSTTFDDYRNNTSQAESYIGSIIALRKFRIRVSIAGSAPGSIIGRASNQVSVLEGQEFGHAKHKSGYISMHKDFSFSTTQTNAPIWTPATGKRYIITDLNIVISTTTTVTFQIFDETNAPGNFLFHGSIRAQNLSPISINLQTPFESLAVDNILRYTNSGAFDISGVLMGYEV